MEFVRYLAVLGVNFSLSLIFNFITFVHPRAEGLTVEVKCLLSKITKVAKAKGCFMRPQILPPRPGIFSLKKRKQTKKEHVFTL